MNSCRLDLRQAKELSWKGPRKAPQFAPGLVRFLEAENPTMKIGVVLPNWIGDVVMATPTLRALRQHFGTEAEIVGIMRPYVSQVLDGTDWLNRSVYFDRKSPDRSLHSLAVCDDL